MRFTLNVILLSGLSILATVAEGSVNITSAIQSNYLSASVTISSSNNSIVLKSYGLPLNHKTLNAGNNNFINGPGGEYAN